MKKLLIVLFCLFTLSSFAQSYLYSYKNQVGVWNQYDQEWVWEKARFAELTFTLGKTYISCNDEAKSFYRIKEDMGDDNQEGYNSHGWKCTDEKGRSCLVNMVYYKEYKFVTLHVMYSDKAFRYYMTSKDSISPFD